MRNYSDILFDHISETAEFKPNAESSFKKGLYGFVKETYAITTPKDSQKYHKPKGKYTLLTFPEIMNNNINADKYYLNKLSESLKDYLIDVDNNSTILVVGLGNRHISADSLGIEVVKNINITRHMPKIHPKICAFAPSVLGLTGIESADIIDGIAGKIKPNYIIMIDSLCASHTARLGVSFQLSNTPITPGSGINNTRKKVSTKTKYLSIGVPLVVYADTFIKSAIDNLQITNKKALNTTIKANPNHLVTLSEIEPIVAKLGQFIANSLNLIFSK